MTEPWLRGPIAGMPAMVMPAAHSLMQSAEDIPAAVTGLTQRQLWVRPGGAASVGFHLRHVAGSIDRLLTYAGGAMLSQPQLATLAAEQQSGDADAESLVRGVTAAIEHALDVMRTTPPGTYLEQRSVGRQRLHSNVIGLLVHVAEHTQRHTGQIITTAKVIRAAV